MHTAKIAAKLIKESKKHGKQNLSRRPATLIAREEKSSSQTESKKPTSQRVSKWLLGGIAVYLMALLMGSGYVFLQLWPATAGAGNATTMTYGSVTLAAWTFPLSEESRLVGLVLAAGAIGSLAYGLWAEYLHVARRDFDQRWALWYFTRPFMGAFLGLVFYLVFRAGLFTTATPAGLNVFGFTALAALVGMFSGEALAKFRLIAESILTKADYLTEDYYSGERAPMDGFYLFVKHTEGTTCEKSHEGLVRAFHEGDVFPPPDDCKQPGVWMRVGPLREQS